MTRTAQTPALDRTEAVAHYVIFRSPPEKLGAVKLNKVMWFADLAAYRKRRSTITGQTSYRKEVRGPCPNNIVNSVRSLCHADKILIRETPTPAGNRKEHIWLKKPDLDVFSAEDVDLLNEAIDWVCNGHTAASISNLSHDALWEEVEIGGQIPIGAASVVHDEVSADDVEWAFKELALIDE